MTAATYDLNGAPSENRNYLKDVAALVDEVLPLGESCRSITAEYAGFLAAHDIRASLSHEEALLEILVLGVLWRTRNEEAKRGAARQRNLITDIVRERRGGLGKRRDGSQNPLLDLVAVGSEKSAVPTVSELQLLADWLYATGEYDDEVKRINVWLHFLTQSETGQSSLRSMLSFTANFEARALVHLEPYTRGVVRFLSDRLPNYAHREDAAQCSRRLLEYHLNMFGTELLNRLWQDEFLATSEQIVVVPACLRARNDTECRALRTETSLRCTHCTKGCVVSQATRVAALYGKPTVAVLHGSDFTQFLRAALMHGTNTGIVGIACAPGILGAGYRAKDTGLPAQCVLLDTSGCGHWRDDTEPVGFDFAELARILKGDVQDQPRANRTQEMVSGLRGLG